MDEAKEWELRPLYERVYRLLPRQRRPRRLSKAPVYPRQPKVLLRKVAVPPLPEPPGEPGELPRPGRFRLHLGDETVGLAQ